MGKVRILYYPDGSVSVVTPAPKSKKIQETEEEWLDRVFTRATPEGVEFDDVDEAEIPIERAERFAWTGSKGKGISVDSAKVAQFEAEQKIEQKILQLTRQQAIDELKGSGELPADYSD